MIERELQTNNESNQEHSSSIRSYRILQHIKIRYFRNCSVFPSDCSDLHLDVTIARSVFVLCSFAKFETLERDFITS